MSAQRPHSTRRIDDANATIHEHRLDTEVCSALMFSSVDIRSVHCSNMENGSRVLRNLPDDIQQVFASAPSNTASNGNDEILLAFH